MWKVYVGNLDPHVREREIADKFRAHGVVRSVWIARNPPGYAFVEFDTRQEADDAISALDGALACARWIGQFERSRNFIRAPSHLDALHIFVDYYSLPLGFLKLCCFYWLGNHLDRKLGKHGWRVEMSRKSSGVHPRGSHGNESRCQECGSSRHRSRDCRARGSRNSHIRSSSPHSRAVSDRKNSPHRKRNRSRSSHSRSPRHDSTYRVRCRSPGKEHDHSSSQKHRRSKSPQHHQHGSNAEGRSCHCDSSKSLQHDHNNSYVDGKSSKRDHSKAPQHDRHGSNADGQSCKSDGSESPQHNQNNSHADGRSLQEDQNNHSQGNT